MDQFLTFTVFGLVTAAIYAVAASGLVVTYTTSGIFNFAHGAIAFSTAYLYYQLNYGRHWSTVAALILSVFVFAPALGLALDRVLLRRVLGNLLKNAVEATRFGGTVRARCAMDERTVEFAVNNEGTVPESVRLQIFQRSFSTKGEGRGLGTYGARLLTEGYMKGTIAFRSEEGEGTTFLARYPRRW